MFRRGKEETVDCLAILICCQRRNKKVTRAENRRTRRLGWAVGPFNVK